MSVCWRCPSGCKNKQNKSHAFNANKHTVLIATPCVNPAVSILISAYFPEENMTHLSCACSGCTKHLPSVRTDKLSSMRHTPIEVIVSGFAHASDWNSSCREHWKPRSWRWLRVWICSERSSKCCKRLSPFPSAYD